MCICGHRHRWLDDFRWRHDHWMIETGVSLRMTHHHHDTIVNVQEGRYLTGLTRARTSLFTVYPGGGWEYER